MTGSDTSQLTVANDCPALTVPGGTPFTIPAGTVVEVVQTLGSAITVRTDRGLMRVAKADAGTLGWTETTDAPQNVFVKRAEFSMENVTEALSTVFDPEIPINIVDLGLIYRCDEIIEADGSRHIDIDLSMTAPGCGMGEILREEVEQVIGHLPGVDRVTATLVWDPPWGFDRLSDEARLQMGMI